MNICTKANVREIVHDFQVYCNLVEGWSSDLLFAQIESIDSTFLHLLEIFSVQRGSESAQVFNCLLEYIFLLEIQLWIGVGIPLTSLAPPHLAACPKRKPGFLT